MLPCNIQFCNAYTLVPLNASWQYGLKAIICFVNFLKGNRITLGCFTTVLWELVSLLLLVGCVMTSCSFSTERCLEDHELIVQVESTMGSESKFLFRKNYAKYEFFKNPMVSLILSCLHHRERGGLQ